MNSSPRRGRGGAQDGEALGAEVSQKDKSRHLVGPGEGEVGRPWDQGLDRLLQGTESQRLRREHGVRGETHSAPHPDTPPRMAGGTPPLSCPKGQSPGHPQHPACMAWAPSTPPACLSLHQTPPHIPRGLTHPRPPPAWTLLASHPEGPGEAGQGPGPVLCETQAGVSRGLEGRAGPGELGPGDAAAA